MWYGQAIPLFSMILRLTILSVILTIAPVNGINAGEREGFIMSSGIQADHHSVPVEDQAEGTITAWYYRMAFGGSLVLENMLWGFDGTIVIRKGFTAGLDYRSALYTAVNMPEDYDGMRQMDRVKAHSVMFGYEFTLPDNGVKLGIEAGPSWVRSKEKVYTVNPRYEDCVIIFGCGPSHHITHDIKDLFGISLQGRVQLSASDNVGTGFAYFVNLNSYRISGGIQICIRFGKAE